MRKLFTLILAAAFVGPAYSEDNNKPLELAGMKSTPPADWKEETPSNAMRQAQFKLPKTEKDTADAELALFAFPGGSGSLEANLKRQVDKFAEEGRKDKVEKIKVGGIEASYQDVTGTFMKKAFPMAKDFTKMENYRQLYVVFEAKDGKQYYMTLLGPKDTVEKHKKGFEDFLKNFK